MAGRLFPACQPKSRGRLDQPAGEEDRRPCRLRAVRRASSVPRFRPQDIRRRGDQRSRPGTASSCAPTSPRNIPKSWWPTSRPWSRPMPGSEADPKTASEMIAKLDRHRQGGRLHLPRPRRNHDDGSDHQAGARAGRRRGRQGVAEPRPDEGVRCRKVGERQLCAQGVLRAGPRLREAARELRQLRSQGRGRLLQEADQRAAQGRRDSGSTAKASHPSAVPPARSAPMST